MPTFLDDPDFVVQDGQSVSLARRGCQVCGKVDDLPILAAVRGFTETHRRVPPTAVAPLMEVDEQMLRVLRVHAHELDESGGVRGNRAAGLEELRPVDAAVVG